MKTLIIGLGNPILGDDGVGWRVAENIARLTENDPEVEVDCVSLGGLSLMERLTGFERTILIDAIFTGENPIGSINRIKINDLPDQEVGHSASVHDTSLHNALNVGRSMNITLPKDEDVIIIAIEARNVYDFTEELSPAVAAAVPRAVEIVLGLLENRN